MKVFPFTVELYKNKENKTTMNAKKKKICIARRFWTNVSSCFFVVYLGSFFFISISSTHSYRSFVFTTFACHDFHMLRILYRSRRSSRADRAQDQRTKTLFFLLLFYSSFPTYFPPPLRTVHRYASNKQKKKEKFLRETSFYARYTCVWRSRVRSSPCLTLSRQLPSTEYLTLYSLYSRKNIEKK